MAWGNSKSIVKRGLAPRSGSGEGKGQDPDRANQCSPPPQVRHVEDQVTPEPEHAFSSTPNTPDPVSRASPQLSAPCDGAEYGDVTDSAKMESEPAPSPTRPSPRRAASSMAPSDAPEGPRTPVGQGTPPIDAHDESNGSETSARSIDSAPKRKKAKEEFNEMQTRAPRQAGRTRRQEMREAAARKEEAEADALEASHLVGLIPRMEQLCSNGIYKPWFHSRFFVRLWIQFYPSCTFPLTSKSFMYKQRSGEEICPHRPVWPYLYAMLCVLRLTSWSRSEPCLSHGNNKRQT